MSLSREPAGSRPDSSTGPAVPDGPDGPDGTVPKLPIRADIEGLRAIAVFSVLLYHAGVAWTPGGFVGVDVFFVISGFLITILMMREVHHTGRLRLVSFWARRARRLLPASALVLLFSAAVTVLWLPVTSRKEFGHDIIASAAYVVNWRFGEREVDYLAEDVGASPVQHYWSLAVEEQFYVVWPVLIALVIGLFRRRKALAPLLTVFALTALSFAWCLYYVERQPGLAFFASTTRVWELGTGALVAAAYPRLGRLPHAVREVLAWGGLVTIGYAVWAFDGSGGWPGSATLVPVVGTAAVLLAGPRGVQSTAAGRLLGIRPLVWIGGLSYSLYLWHWPFLIAADGIWGAKIGVSDRLLVVAASVVPAYLSYRYVEAPIRSSKRWASNLRAMQLGTAAMVVSGAAGLAVIASVGLVKTVDQATPDQAPGAMALLDEADTTDWSSIDSVSVMRPSPLEADDPPIYDSRECTPAPLEERTAVCEFGDPDAERTLVLVGDSKAAQWFTPMRDIVEQSGWRLVLINKGACSFADVVRPVDGQRNESCDKWSQWALEQVESLAPDVVVTTTRGDTALRPDEDLDDALTADAMIEGLVSHWQAVVETGAILVPVLDNPGLPGGGAPECVQRNLDNLTACGFDFEEAAARSGAPAQLAAAKRVPQARVIDMRGFICPGQSVCPPVVGNVLVYRSASHITDTYAASARPILSDRLARATEGLIGQRLP